MDSMHDKKTETIRDLRSALAELHGGFIGLAISHRETNPELSYSFYKHSEECLQAYSTLEAWIPKEMEMEGGGSTWWYVCPECHGAIDQNDHYCRHCGQAIKK